MLRPSRVPVAVQISSPNAHPLMTSHGPAVTLALFVIGLVLAVIGLTPLVRRWHWRASAVRATGRVVDNVQAPLTRRVRWFPIIEFGTWRVLVTSDLPAGPSRFGWPVGEAVDVLYQPQNPTSATLANAGWTLSGWLVAGVSLIVVAATI
jgi:hypothetical protein